MDPAPALGSPWETGLISSKWKGPKRLWDLLHQFMRVADGCDVGIIEGYAFAKGFRAHQMGELGGVIRLGFFQKKIPLVVIPPTTLKKFAIGRGRVKKGEDSKAMVLAEAIRRLNYSGSSIDQADALWLLQMGIHQYKLPGAVKLPQNHMAALSEEIEWPVQELEF